MAYDMSSVLDELPDEIKFLAEPVRRYRISNGGDAIEEKLKTLTQDEIKELNAIGKRVYEGGYYHNHIARFLDSHDNVSYKECYWLESLFYLLDELDVSFDRSDDKPYTYESNS